MRDEAIRIQETLRIKRFAREVKTHVLLTAPHASSDHIPLDDPCTASITNTLAYTLRRSGTRVHSVLAHHTRKIADQNRFPGMEKLHCDMWERLTRYRKRFPSNALKHVLHIDVHSFTATDEGIKPLGWGTGINLIVTHGDKLQREIAACFARSLDAALGSHTTLLGKPLQATRVIAMPTLPETLKDDDHNAMIEWSRYHGAASMLLEIPTVRTSGTFARPVYVTSIPENDIVHALHVSIHKLLNVLSASEVSA